MREKGEECTCVTLTSLVSYNMHGTCTCYIVHVHIISMDYSHEQFINHTVIKALLNRFVYAS